MITEAITRLTHAAWTTGLGWLPEQWTLADGTTTPLRPLRYLGDVACGNFDELRLPPGERTVLTAPLDIPPTIAGIALAGEPLQMALYSVYPIEVTVDGREVFVDRTPPVAVGPALFEVLATITGHDGTLQLTVEVPAQQSAVGWLHVRLTTPGLRRRQDLFDQLAAQLTLADAVAGDDRTAIDDAAQLVPDDLLDLRPDQLDALVANVQDRLAPLASALQALEVHLVGHSHIDLAWLWTWEDTCDVVVRDAISVLALMDDYPEMVFTHSQPATYEVLRDRAPELLGRIRDHIGTGRWEPATMQWVEADANLPSGEAAVRQLVEGVRFTREQLGTSPRVLLAPDTFGHANNLPQLAVSAGTDVYYHHRANPGGHWPAYWWQGTDGTRLLAVTSPTYVGDLSATAIACAMVRGPLAADHSVGLHFYGIGDHGGGPTRESLDRIRALGQLDAFPRLRCSTVGAYADALLASEADLPIHVGESPLLFEGCYTTHGDVKSANRSAENALVTAQTLAAVAGMARHGELSQAWRNVLHHQFHDILDGSAIPEAYAKTVEDCAAATALADEVTTDALDVLHAGSRGDIVVTNPLGVLRTDVVTIPWPDGGPVAVLDDAGAQLAAQRTTDGICFVATVDGLSSRSFSVVPDDDEGGPSVGPAGGALDRDAYLEVGTSHHVAVVRKDCGIITSLVDRRTGRELVGYGMRRDSDYLDTARPDLALNVLTAVLERPHGMSAWHLDEVVVEEHLLGSATTTVVEQGPVRVVVQSTRKWRSSTITQRMTFYDRLPRIDLDYDIDWQEIGGADVGVPGLKAAFTASLPQVDAWFETPYAAVCRPSNGQESPALRWACVGGADGSIAVLNAGKYGHDALGGRLRVTLLRNAYFPDGQSDTGRHRIRLALLPCPGGWRDAGVVDEAAGFNQPLLARRPATSSPVLPGQRSVWRPVVDAGPVRIGTLDLTPTGDRLVRLYDAHGVGGTVRVSNLDGHVHEAGPDGTPIRALTVEGGGVELTFRPWQLRTLLVTGGQS